MKEMKFAQEINQALADAMQVDGTVMLLGEDIGEVGGSFKATRGLLGRFGTGCVRDTPISEASLALLVVGAAMSGARSVVEIMFMDFITLAMDALVNQAAKAHFVLAGRASVLMVLRTLHGGGLNAGPQHSQCLEVWLAHVPGLELVCPSTPADAMGCCSWWWICAVCNPGIAPRCWNRWRASIGWSSCTKPWVPPVSVRRSPPMSVPRSSTNWTRPF